MKRYLILLVILMLASCITIVEPTDAPTATAEPSATPEASEGATAVEPGTAWELVEHAGLPADVVKNAPKIRLVK